MLSITGLVLLTAHLNLASTVAPPSGAPTPPIGGLDFVLVTDDKDDAKKDDKDKVELEWKSPDGEQEFKAGVAAFEKGEYETAGDLFKSAYRDAKSRETKDEVKRWRAASEGGVFLTLAQKNQKVSRRALLAEIERAAKQLEGTPIEAKYREACESLGREIFEVLEDFEHESKRYSEKYGKKFIQDEKEARVGKSFIEWKTTGNDAELKVERLPEDLSSYWGIAMWIKFPKSGAPYQVVFKGKGKSQSNYGQTMTNAFIAQMKPHRGGWKRVEVPFKDFAAQGDVQWTSVEDFRIQFIGRRNILLYVDDIALVRNK